MGPSCAFLPSDPAKGGVHFDKTTNQLVCELYLDLIMIALPGIRDHPHVHCPARFYCAHRMIHW